MMYVFFLVMARTLTPSAVVLQLLEGRLLMSELFMLALSSYRRR
jgi:hypothetical protein